jgi:phosphohistidine phosphatase
MSEPASARRQLQLLRHAKSSWAEPGLDDHARPLAPRGEKAMRQIGKHLARVHDAPQLILCSSARRATMTLDGIASALPSGVETRIEDSLYAASGGELLTRVRQVADDVGRVMMIGHNPGLEDLAIRLVGSGDDDLRSRMAAKFPTGALATLTFAGSWTGLGPGRAKLEAFVVPREL